MLTKKQHELLLFINKRLGETGICPSFDEMKESLGLKSKSGVHRLITGLEERGFIRRLAHRARALEVARLPENMAPNPAAAAKEATIPPWLCADGHSRRFRRCAAGRFGGPAGGDSPASALRSYRGRHPDRGTARQQPERRRSRRLLGRGEHYALEVDGDSMINAGILDGDTVVIERCETAENGTIVVALIDNAEVTLKRLRRKGDSIALEPANPAYETRIFGPDRVKLQGRLAGLIRRY